jgi:hypothetical protein
MTAKTANDASARAHARSYLCRKRGNAVVPKGTLSLLLRSDLVCGLDSSASQTTESDHPQGRGFKSVWSTLVTWGTQDTMRPLFIAGAASRAFPCGGALLLAAFLPRTRRIRHFYHWFWIAVNWVIVPSSNHLVHKGRRPVTRPAGARTVPAGGGSSPPLPGGSGNTPGRHHDRSATHVAGLGQVKSG